ncbi:hypothetical protein HID58_089460 [Brassica napus]|uniref:Uncharacterized protein n=1 Tax=Brassica napus TaxID=3708 RepID=A0ABQ7XZ36_BRANA|nr:hypothetical protein HID58_090118 [Brassica napus]KAH0861199.1 hypothetical protein HID58_089460 [Brassica napus]
MSESGRCSSVVEARLLRYWEADPVFEAMLIQRSINVYRFNTFNEGSVYESNPNFKFGDAPVSIRFTEHTVFVGLAETRDPIPWKGFGFSITTTSYFVGDVRGIKTIYNEEIQSTLRLMTITRRRYSDVELKMVVATNIFGGCSSTLLLVLIQIHRTFRSEIKTERHHWLAEYHEWKKERLNRYQ